MPCYEKDDHNSQPSQILTSEEADAIGEIGNIIMGTGATTLSTLINKKVVITTPYSNNNYHKKSLLKQYPIPFVAAEVKYTEGLEGTNILIIQERDVKIITDLMMGEMAPISTAKLLKYTQVP